MANIKFIRGTTNERKARILLAGEPGWDTDQKCLYVGDGITYGGIPVTGTGGMVNRIHNPDGNIDQRNEGAAITPAADTITVDRWRYVGTQASKQTIQKRTDTPPPNKTSYVRLTTASAFSPTGNDYFMLAQNIEADTISDFGFGTVYAKKLRFRCWARCSQIASIGACIRNTASNRSHAFFINITAANVWQQITVTIPGDQIGTWVMSGNDIGMLFNIATGCGVNYVGNPGVWEATVSRGAVGNTNLIAVAGATLDLSGIELFPAEFDGLPTYRSVADEEAICRRYFRRLKSEAAYHHFGGSGYAVSTALSYMWLNYSDMRAAPAGSYSALSDFLLSDQVNTPITPTSITFINAGKNRLLVTINVAAGLVQFRNYVLYANNLASAKIDLSADL